MLLYAWNMIFLGVWVGGMHSFVSMRDIPGMRAREWRLKLLANLFALVYTSYMCFTLERFYSLRDLNPENDFTQFCPSFMFFAFLYPPMMCVVRTFSLWLLLAITPFLPPPAAAAATTTTTALVVVVMDGWTFWCGKVMSFNMKERGNPSYVSAFKSVRCEGKR